MDFSELMFAKSALSFISAGTNKILVRTRRSVSI